MSKDPVTGNLDLFIYTIQVPFNSVIEILTMGPLFFAIKIYAIKMIKL